jgi:hypothetical protein
MPGKTKSPNLSFPSWRKMATARGHNGTRCYRAAFIRCGRLGAYCGRRRVCNVISGGQFSFSPALTRTRSHRYQSADDCPAANAVGERDSRCAIATAIVCVSGTTSGYVRRRSKETKESKKAKGKGRGLPTPIGELSCGRQWRLSNNRSADQIIPDRYCFRSGKKSCSTCVEASPSR